ARQQCNEAVRKSREARDACQENAGKARFACDHWHVARERLRAAAETGNQEAILAAARKLNDAHQANCKADAEQREAEQLVALMEAAVIEAEAKVVEAAKALQAAACESRKCALVELPLSDAV